MIYGFISIIVIFILWILFSFFNDINLAKQRLSSYPLKTFHSSFGKTTFVDKGQGEVVLISHGIFGGYDQGLISLEKLNLNSYRLLSPSRFGYPNTDLPKNPTPSNQAQSFKELIDELEITKIFLLVTSAGGASGLQFAIQYPDRIKGLILLSSGAPDRPRTMKEIKEMGLTGPPCIVVNNFFMWIGFKFFGRWLNSMFGSKNISNEQLLNSIFPIKERKKGVIADTEITNIDMTLNYKEYPLEKIQCPILVIHAKDDPMTSFNNIENLLTRVTADTFITDSGGHLIEGFDCSGKVEEFILKNK